jgi:hypothetical protein
VLFITIDMRQAPFFGWIKDLSAPDPTSLFNLFGLLPYQVPEMLHVGVWPLIMGMTMWVQMQLNPQQPDPVQQKIFNWMPVIFTFMLASFPSGLVIYWAWNNVLSLLQQYTIMRKNNTEIHLWKNLGADKWRARLAAAKGVDVGKAVDVGKMKERFAGASSSVQRSLGKVLKRGPRAEDGPTKAAQGDGSMTREQALSTLGLHSDASEREIDAALAKQSKQQRTDLNGSDHAIAAKIDAAREILRGRERS